jgi:hypothetical protein
LVPGVLRRDFGQFDEVFREHCAATLFGHRIDLNLFPVLLTTPSVTLATTNDRRVLGSMNDYAFLFKHHIAAEGGLSMADIPRLNNKMNQTPMSAIKGRASIDAVKVQLGQLAT